VGIECGAARSILPMKLRHHLPAMALLGFTSSAFALKIEIRYDQDPNGFFAANPAAKTALRAAADFYEPLIHDSLLAINPGTTGNGWTATIENPSTGASGYVLPAFVVPADAIIIFANGRALGNAAGRGSPGGQGTQTVNGDANWPPTVRFRGQAGAELAVPTDFGRWGGYVTFNTSITWNFSLTDPTADGVPFLSAALHEIGHVLGIGASVTTPSWGNKVVNGHFTGTHAVQVYGGNIPLNNTDHWRDDNEDEDEPGVLSKAYGAFGTPHGAPQNGLMDPRLPSAGNFYAVVTELDLAALRDIGWEVDPPLLLTAPMIRPSASPYLFSWPSTTGYTYRLQRSTALAPDTWTDLSTQPGNGLTLQFSTTVPAGLTKAFYRLTTEPPAAAAMAAAKFATPTPQIPVDVVDPEGGVEGCGCSSHGHHQ
jgi:hypothetical protein